MKAQAPQALILDLLEWLARRERTYEETMDAWRTSCPRLTVWEDANDCGLITTEHSNGLLMVRVAPSGLNFLRAHRPDLRGIDSRPPFAKIRMTENSLEEADE